MKRSVFILLCFFVVSLCHGEEVDKGVPGVLKNNNRPPLGERNFRSEAVEKKIEEVVALLKNERLALLFVNCFPNTLDTTVEFEEDAEGNPDTFVYTGDIHAMWLRDSGAQVFPYVSLARNDQRLRKLLAGVILRQFKCIN